MPSTDLNLFAALHTKCVAVSYFSRVLQPDPTALRRFEAMSRVGFKSCESENKSKVNS